MTHSEQPPPFKTSRPTRGEDGKREAESDRLALRSRSSASREQALQAAIHQLVPSWQQDRADSPDEVVTAIRRMPAAEAQVAPMPPGVDPRLVQALSSRGITELYTHQSAAVAYAMAGQSVVVTTPTASGKTLCYNIPVLNSILSEPSTRALYLFPTKALAQDQLAELDRLAQAIDESAGLDLGVFTYDGDTPQDARRAIRSRAQVILPTPTCSTRGSCRTTRSGRGCSRTSASSSSTSCTPIAACLAATCRTSCADCAASVSTTARTPCSSVRRPPSPIRGSWPNG